MKDYFTVVQGVVENTNEGKIWVRASEKLAAAPYDANNLAGNFLPGHRAIIILIKHKGGQRPYRIKNITTGITYDSSTWAEKDLPGMRKIAGFLIPFFAIIEGAPFVGWFYYICLFGVLFLFTQFTKGVPQAKAKVRRLFFATSTAYILGIVLFFYGHWAISWIICSACALVQQYGGSAITTQTQKEVSSFVESLSFAEAG